MDNELECPICLKNISDGLFVSHCLHIFCLECIQKALESKKSCPLCRKKLYYRPEGQYNHCSRNIKRQGGRIQTRFQRYLSDGRHITYTVYLMENFENGNRWMESRDESGFIVSSLPFWINSF